MIYDQAEFDVRFEWGEQGVASLARISDVVIIVDVLSFSTCVDIAVTRGAIVFPYLWKDESALFYAESVNAELADTTRNTSRYSLSPDSLTNIIKGTRIVLPSPNGATQTLKAKDTTVIAGCLRNALAVGAYAGKYAKTISVIAAGERWNADGSIRHAFEDFVGAGAIINSLNGSLSPEAFSAKASFMAVEARVAEYIKACSSGKELIERGFENDVMLATEINISNTVPVLSEDLYFST